MASVAAIAATVTGVGERVMDRKVAAVAQDHHHLLHQQQQQQHQRQQIAQHKSQLQQQQQQQQQNQEALRCPRCDSTNTKFCYYNNYSLSQPRYFCKACKRYWTRGGTLRNVPVGGGCRRNKRVKRPSSSSSSFTSLTNNSNNSNNIQGSVNSSPSVGGGGGNSGQIHDLLSSASNHVNPLFYGLPTNHSANSDISFPFSSYDLQNPPQINGLGLGFSSGLVHNMNSMNLQNHPPQNAKQIFQDLISSNPLLSNYTSFSTTTTSTSINASPPTISSVLASSLHQMKGVNNFQALLPSYEDDDLHNIKGNNGGMFNSSMKDVKMEFNGQNRSLDHHHHHHHHWNASNNTQNQIDQQTMASSSDPSILWGSNTGTNLATWLDPTNNNLGSSVPSLI